MKRNALVVVAVAGAAVVLIAAVSVAGATSTSGEAKTKVTIAPWDRGLLGTVTSTPRCAKDREVKVFRQLGAQQDPKSDKVIGTATAHQRHRVYQWSLNKGTSGRFYAKATKREGCRPGFSETYRIRPQGGIPLCPSHQEVCQIDQIHIRLKSVQGLPCPSNFADGTLGLCGGTAETGRYWGGVPDGVGFSWFTAGALQSVTYSATGYSKREPYGGTISGFVPVGTKAFYVFNAQNSKEDFFYDDFYTPSTPGVDPGSPGGPLYLEYTPGNLVIRGFLYNHCNQGCHD
jgi:hypothetical protein